MLLLSILLFELVFAQRPSNASICDYYAEKLYGVNTSATQNKLIQSIVSLAYVGGSTLPNARNITGILNPGKFMNLSVDLQPWFDGSIASTNLNGQAVGINWLDDGVDIIENFLAGDTSTIQFNSSSNEYRLFNHFFYSFSQVFGCTLPQPEISSSTPDSSKLNVAYVHKYMNLNFTDIGHFINQLTLATSYYGFSAEDSQTLSTQLNSLYNVRCAPPVNGQLMSLCQAENCPLAEPQADCKDYVDLGPNGIVSSSASTGTTSSAATNVALSTISTSPTTSSSPQMTSSTSSSNSDSPSNLSSGAIAGISLAAAAVFLLAILVLIHLIRRSSTNRNRNPNERTSVDPFHISVPGYSSPGLGSLAGGNQPLSYSPDGIVFAGRMNQEMDAERHGKNEGLGLGLRHELSQIRIGDIRGNEAQIPMAELESPGLGGFGVGVRGSQDSRSRATSPKIGASE